MKVLKVMEKSGSFSGGILRLGEKTNSPEIFRKSAEENCLRSYANRNRLKGNFNDVTINVGNRNFPANRLVLSCYSSFFEEIFTTDEADTWDGGSEEIHPVAMEQIIEFIYTGTIQVHNENVAYLLAASSYMKIWEVKQFCSEFLENSIAITTVIVILNLAEKYNCEILKEKAEKFILENLGEIISSEGFKNLSLNKMLDCLYLQNRTKINEVTFYKAIIKWVNYNLEVRRKDFQSLFRKVDLSLLTIEYLEDVISNEVLVRGNLTCLKRLHDAIVQAERQSRNKDNRKRIVSLGGHRTLSKVEEIYNLTYDENLRFPELPQGVSSLSAVVVDNYLYCIGGQTVPLKNEMSTNHVYRLVLNSYNAQWEKISSISKKRYVMGAASVHGSIFVIGGTDEAGCKLSSGEYFSPSLGKWKSISPLKGPRSGHALVACNGYLYAIGGFGNGNYLETVERYDVNADAWTDVAPMKNARRWFAAVVLNEIIYVIGGQPEKDNRSILRSVEVYDPTKDSWTYASEMNIERAACSACVMQGKIFVSGGLNKNGNPVRTIESYHSYDDEWRVAGKTDVDLWHHAVVALP